MKYDPPIRWLPDTLNEELQTLRRVVMAEERERPTGRSLSAHVLVRQADYLTRKIVAGHLPHWAELLNDRPQAACVLAALKTELDGADATNAHSTAFAKKVLHDVEWAQAVKAAIERPAA